MSEVDPPSESTSLARRSPAGLARAPSFYPTGHADPGVLARVTVAGPLVASATLAAFAGVLGLGIVGAVGFGIAGAPLGLFWTDWYFEHRGKRPLRAALALFAHSPERGRTALARIAGSRAWLPEVRLEAAGRLAIDALERGEIAEAIERLEIGEQDAHLLRRRRSFEVGARAELLRSVLAWLSPDSFAEVGIADSAAFGEPGEDAEAAALLSALRVLEAAGAGDEARLAAAWADVAGSRMAEVMPTLHAIVTAVAAERLHHLADPLHERLRADPDGRLRRLLRRIFPRMQLLAEDGYRGVSADLPTEAEQQSLDIVAPDELTALVRPEARDLAPVSRAAVATMFGGVYGLLVALGLSLTLVEAPLALAVIAGVFGAIYIGTPIAAIAGGSLVQARERARRVAPLYRLLPPPPLPWLVECAAGPPGPVTASSGYRRLSPLPASQLVLYAACLRGEQALARGELDEAWDQVEWYFAGFSGALPGRDPMYAIGSSLLRLAVLTGHLAQAERLAAVVPMMDHPWDDPSRRTAWGNAARALALAHALLAARQGQWDAAASRLDEAVRARPVFLTAHDRVLYEALARGVRARGHEIRWRPLRTDARLSEWLRRVWPEAQGPLTASDG